MILSWAGRFGGHRGFCGNAGGHGLLALLILLVIVVVIYFIWRGRRNKGKGPQPSYLSNLTDAELEEELAKRKSASNLEAEVADLKKQLEELKNKDGETEKEITN